MRIAIEGSIGVGKSTLCKQLGNVLKNHTVVYEPVTDNPYLEDYYQEPSRWALSMQIELLTHRAKNIQSALEVGPNLILDRSLPGDYVFAAANRRFGYMSEREFNTYHRFYRIVKDTTEPLDVVIYLHADPEVIWERIKNRAREVESGIDPGYFRVLCEEYDKAMSSESNVTFIDWHQFQDVSEIVKRLEL